jgi:type IV pilus assembly protein PilA
MSARLRRRLLRDEQGFTLLELLIVVIILGILVMIALPSYLALKGRAQDASAKQNVRTAVAAIESYYQDNQSYSGMSLANLQASYDAGLNVSNYTLAGVTATSYCVQSPQGSGTHVWRKNGPAALLERNHC